jgi:hypothetical protein
MAKEPPLNKTLFSGNIASTSLQVAPVKFTLKIPPNPAGIHKGRILADFDGLRCYDLTSITANDDYFSSSFMATYDVASPWRTSKATFFPFGIRLSKSLN